MNVDCPHCGQAITCDDQWAGQQLQCPLCQGAFSVPAAHNPLVPKPSAGGANKLSLGGHSQKPAQPGRDIPIRNLAPPVAKKKSPLVKVITTVLVLAALGAGGYFGWGWVSSYQEKVNAKRRQEEKNADGGQVGHIADLYDVLDRTEPGRVPMAPRGGHASGPRAKPSGVGEEIPLPAGAAAANATPGAADTNAAVVAPVYTLDVAQAKIPEGRVNGTISGTNFVSETARLDAVGGAAVLRFFQGQLTSPDREILIYLHPKASDKMSGMTLSINSDSRGFGLPTVTKLWKPNPKYAAQTKPFSFGYALKLELGQITNGIVPGKVFVALPDNEQTVVAGVFNAATTLTDAGGVPAAAAPGAVPAGGPVNDAFQKRYGPR